MNRFLDLIEDMKERAKADEKVKDLLPGLDDLSASSPGDVPEQNFRLPYSSDPKPVDDPWY